MLNRQGPLSIWINDISKTQQVIHLIGAYFTHTSVVNWNQSMDIWNESLTKLMRVAQFVWKDSDRNPWHLVYYLNY